MPRKPSSVFVIAEAGGPVLQAWRIPISDDSNIETIVQQQLLQAGLGVAYVVEDTKVSAYKASSTLEQIDDPRLPDET